MVRPKYAWVITKDCMPVEGALRTPPIIGPRGTDLIAEEITEKGEKFRMLDDDRNVYFEGYICGYYDGFEPLDDYGMPDSGCTTIQYLTGGEWRDL